MIISMTGFNYSSCIIDGIEYTSQIKTLNSKTFDFSVKSPNDNLDSKIRLLAKKILKRGKVEFSFRTNFTKKFNQDLLDLEKIELYITQLKKISPDSSRKDLLQLVISMPGLHNKSSYKLTKKNEKQ